MLESVTASALGSALDGLAMRQRVIANNIANVNTPDYHAKRVLFEDALAESVQRKSGVVAPEVKRSLEPTLIDGNNVNLDTETLSNIDTVLRIQFATQAVSAEFAQLRTAMRSA